uniref:F-box domain-containing protein n=1 Tax=Lepeophtheirus salmonis TaxID=72036 RepID=A0A0K2TNE3_LEPSM
MSFKSFESQKDSFNEQDESLPYFGTWKNLPHINLLAIFAHLEVRELLSCSHVCRRWNDISKNNTLWKRLFLNDFHYKRGRMKTTSNYIHNSNQDWKRRYLKNIYTVPRISVEVLKVHDDEVLHVSFSNDSLYFVTCSKDCKAIIWRTKDLEIDEIHNMSKYGWMFTWASKFSPSDKRLLISGVVDEIGGEIVVMERSKEYPHNFQKLCRVMNDPYDVVGCWWSDRYFISGTIKSSSNDQFQASIWLCEPRGSDTIYNESIDEEMSHNESLISINLYKYCLFKYKSLYISYLRNLLCVCLSQMKNVISSVPIESEGAINESIDPNVLKLFKNESDEYVLVFMCSDLTSIPHKIGFYKLTPDRFSFTPVITSPDAAVELNGHTVGLNLSKDRRYLYVSLRSWPENSLVSAFELPAISSEIETKVIDMKTLTLVEDLTFFGHKAFTPSHQAYYLYLDTSESFITSGSENSKGIIWERSSGIKLSELKHDACVNSVAFYPNDEERCISISDDGTIKVWESLNRYKSSSNYDELKMKELYTQ